MDATTYLENTPLKKILGIPAAALDQAMAKAYLLYTTGHYDQAEILCRGLIAADHRYWWSYSLYAAALRRMGRLDEALQQINLGLKFEPNQTKLLLMRGEILSSLGRHAEAKLDLSPVTITGRPEERRFAHKRIAQIEAR